MKIKIEILSDWHCGSGLSSGADVDLLCVKDESGLPYIPGKTIKGLLKEAANVIFPNDDFIKVCFGEQTNKKSSQSEKGSCYFSNAELTEKLKNELLNNNDKIPLLFRKISSTAIDENGIAKEHSLRKIEVAVPLTLFAEISDLDENYEDKMVKCLKYVKKLGSNRNRGLGRCNISAY